MDAIDTLPDDPVVLKQMIVQIKQEAAERIDAARQQAKEEAAALVEALTQQAQVEALLRRFYGPKSERFDPTQLLLFGLVMDSLPIDGTAVEQQAGEPLTTRRIQHKHGRSKLPESLPRVPIEHDLTPQEKLCPCCGQLRCRIGQEISEQLEYVPASFKVLQHIRHKYACKPCGDGCAKCDGKPQIEIAIKAAQPIEKGLPGPGLLAYIITGKLADHLPLYRLESIFERLDVHIARSTMCGWMFAAAELVRPLVTLMGERVRQSRVVHTDDTRVPVQREEGGPCKSGRIWTYIGDRDHPYIVYDYTPDRTRAGPSKWLDKFKGYLQADAYGGYDGIYSKGDVTEVACWAHARRKFFDAKDTDGQRSAAMLSMVRELYAVEDRAKAKIAELTDPTCDQADALRRELRQEQSVPILAQIKDWLDEQRKLILPRSVMAEAMTYTLNQWDALCAYTTQGFLAIDNNAAERAVKRVAIGRKNWLFAGNDTFGGVSATLYTLIASAERHSLDPQAYLRGILARIASTPVTQLEQFLPERWNNTNGAVAS